MQPVEMILRPLTETELKLLTKELMGFFSVMNNEKMRKVLSLPPIEKVMQPLSLFRTAGNFK